MEEPGFTTFARPIHRRIFQSLSPPKVRPMFPVPRLIWTSLTGDDANCDALPAWLTPPSGCPECKSVWTHVLEVGFSPECGRGIFKGDLGYLVEQVGSLEPVLAVRLVCFGDHLVEYDGTNLKLTQLPSWGSTVGMGILAIAAAMFMVRKA